jgi:hypothetical protein
MVGAHGFSATRLECPGRAEGKPTDAFPAGSLVVDDGALRKLFGVPVGVPKYRWHGLTFQSTVLFAASDGMIERERSPWFLAILRRYRDQPLPDAALALIDYYSMVRIPTCVPGLAVYVGEPRDPAGPPGGGRPYPAVPAPDVVRLPAL